MRKMCVLLLAVIMMAFALYGCTYGIHADAVEENLPQIDPNAGIARELNVRLFYRLAHEAYIAGITKTVEVGSDERAELAIVNALINAPDDLPDGASSPFPEGTQVLDVKSDNYVHYVTLSKEFLTEDTYYKQKSEADLLLSNGNMSNAQYNKALSEARSEMLLLRRLSLYAIVNTLSQLDERISVQVMVEQEDSDMASRLTRAQLGLESISGSMNVALEPLGYVDDAVATPLAIVQCVMSNIESGDYENAYSLFARTTANGRGIKPALEKASEDMRTLGKISKYDVKSYLVDSSGTAAYVSVSAEIKAADGKTYNISTASMLLFREDGLYRLDYDTFMRIMRGGS